MEESLYLYTQYDMAGENYTDESGNMSLFADESESQVDKDFQENVLFYLMGIGGMGVCCLGLVANCLSVAVLTRRCMRSSTYMYLAALAVCDALVLVFTAFLLLKDTKMSSTVLDRLYPILFPYVHPAAILFQVTSIWLTMAFTVDRYIMICHPFRAETMCRRSRAKKVVVTLYIAGVVFCVPKFLEYQTQKHEIDAMNMTEVMYAIDLTDIGKNEVFRVIVHSWLYLLCVCGLPFLTLVILNAFLIHAVRMSRLKGKVLNAKERHRNNTTIMLIGVVIIFLICQGPALASRMVYAFKPVGLINKADFTLNEVANFLVILNSAINIVPYYFFGRKFRTEFWRLFCACFYDRDELSRMTRSFSLSVDPQRKWSIASNNCEMANLRSNSRSNSPTPQPRITTPLIGSDNMNGLSKVNSTSLQYLNPGLCRKLDAQNNGHARYSTDDVTSQTYSKLVNVVLPEGRVQGTGV